MVSCAVRKRAVSLAPKLMAENNAAITYRLACPRVVSYCAMSVTVTRKVSFFFSSDPAAGSQALSADGDSFSVNLSPPLKIPKNALSCEFYVPQASIWNTSPNISSSFSNNTFKFTTSAAAAPGTYTITFPEGLYSLEAIGSYLSAQFVNLSLPANLFTLSGNDSTSQTVITFSIA